MCFGVKAISSATSGAPSCCMCRPSQANNIGITTCSTRYGTYSTWCPKDAEISSRSSTTRGQKTPIRATDELSPQERRQRYSLNPDICGSQQYGPLLAIEVPAD